MSDREQTPMEGADPPGTAKEICGAKTRTGKPCQKPPIAFGRCRLHGGSSKSGTALPQFKHGRYSKALAKLGEDIDGRISDPALLDPRRSIAVQEGVMARLSEMADAGDGPEFREAVRKGLAEGLELMAEDPRAALDRIRGVFRLVQRGAEATRALTGLGHAAAELGKGQERYWRTAMQSARAIPPDEFVGIMFKLADIIEQEVDREAARRILGRTDREVCGGALGLDIRE